MVEAMRDDTAGRKWQEGLLCLRTVASNVRVQIRNSSRVVLYIGLVDPFPLELFQTDSGWQFDGPSGIRQLLRRRIRRNQLAAIEMCRRYVEAQWNSIGHQASETKAFSPRISSSPGRQDGLYWSDPEAAEESPLGPRFARAAFAEQDGLNHPQPYFGYYFKALHRQGPAAPGGALDYLVNGRMVNGFALLAWPAEYGRTGVVSYLINHSGDIYQRDLGKGTHSSALTMVEFNPDASWKKVGSAPDEE
jgi:hypothetical protein